MSDVDAVADTYEILDGVRRAKAYALAGRSFVPVRIDNAGRLGPTVDIAIDRLYSPKKVIETSGVGLSRWRKVQRAVENGGFSNGNPVPPIEVTPGRRGTPIADVTIEGEDEFERLF